MPVELDQNESWERLHEVRLRGMLEAGDPVIEHLVDVGYLLRRGTMAVITPLGKAAHAEWAGLPEGSDEQAAARQAYITG